MSFFVYPFTKKTVPPGKVGLSWTKLLRIKRTPQLSAPPKFLCGSQTENKSNLATWYWAHDGSSTLRNPQQKSLPWDYFFLLILNYQYYTNYFIQLLQVSQLGSNIRSDWNWYKEGPIRMLHDSLPDERKDQCIVLIFY